MSFSDLDIKLSYISCGEENIAQSFLLPALKQAKRYQRSVGYFSSSVFAPVLTALWRCRVGVEKLSWLPVRS